MKRSWTRSNGGAIILPIALPVIAAVVLGLTGCYEGWKKPSRPDGGGTGPGKPTTPAERPIGVLIFDVIRPSEEAMKTAGCYSGPSSLIEYRLTEWALRIKAIEETLKETADVVKRVDIEMAGTSCLTLDSIELRATQKQANVPSNPHLREKPAVHLKAIFWDQDIPFYKTFSANVTREDWTELDALRRSGFRKSVSLHYSVLSGYQYGNFRYWRDALSSMNRLSGVTIENPQVTEQGQAEIMVTVQRSTEEFATWLLERASRL